ncbi:fuconate dehydratase [Micrococcus luteus]|uniref:enolase C-terminal domain-like protein n=1 Tax=Micrococcus luteus TaxID=1270 RepID=UPI000C9C0674|nr:enolase C-terminal domain-like protein [Micrococcus luteus]MCV7523997.1 fuconate dehydratase [Micrococcus luteus]MCV7697698.1 fuconate dehydratase [Micrococcus luteus]MCV7712548.1 fuconate dehydratase [Micrococcus luteus]MCV7714764.1 fuconate dehydratase [Micrococcus luteus]PMC36460.1 fuconate dehydratase [Micrococcus luteus]
MSVITSIDFVDLRFPTSESADGSDAVNKDADYSAAYLRINTSDDALYGCGFTFTIGRGNDICLSVMEEMTADWIGRDAVALADDPGAVYRCIAEDSQLRWLGPDKGVVHLARAAVLNAVWDMAARHAGQPLWKYIAEMDPERLVDAFDLSYLSDVLTRDEAVALLAEQRPQHAERIAELESRGFPCYTTSAGWLGYSDEKLARLAKEAVDQGFQHVKLKVGLDIDEDQRRLSVARKAIGPDVHLMIDANQIWDVPEAIEKVTALSDHGLLWIEEPTSPDDVLGHKEIAEAVRPLGIGVATGEHGMNRVLFKQLLQADAVDYVQIDSCRLASINEILPVLLMAKKFGKPVCPHAGGVGLCELVSHLVMIDYVAVSGEVEGRVAEFVDHLHEHFVDPCLVRNGAYVLPSQPGYSSEIRTETIRDWAYPHGTEWAARRTAVEA